MGNKNPVAHVCNLKFKNKTQDKDVNVNVLFLLSTKILKKQFLKCKRSKDLKNNWYP